MRMLRRSAVVAFVAAVVLVGAAPANAGSLTIAPASGSQSDTYTIQGADLPAGLALDIDFMSPDGNVYPTAALNQVVVVADDGSFTFQFVPTNEFAGESLGTWTSQICTAGTDDCVQTTFDIGA